MRRLFALAVVAVLLGAAPAFSQDAPVPVDSRLSQREVAVGDEFTLRFDAPAGASADSQPRVSGLPDEIVLKRARVAASEDPAKPAQVELTLASFDLEIEEIPPLSVDVRTADGKLISMETGRHSLVMKRLTGDEELELKDVKGPRGAELSVGRYILYFLAIVAFLVLAVWALRRYLRARGALPPPVDAAPPPRPAHEPALEALDALEARDLPGQGRLREQCFELSEIFRAYLEGRYGFRAGEQTTDELRRAIKGVSEIVESDRVEAIEIFEEQDLVKFAKLPMEEARGRTMLSQIRDWVTRTIPAAPSALDIAQGRAR